MNYPQNSIKYFKNENYGRKRKCKRIMTGYQRWKLYVKYLQEIKWISLSCMALTSASLNGCIKIPKGNLDFWRRELVSGTFVNVHLNMLQIKNKHVLIHTLRTFRVTHSGKNINCLVPTLNWKKNIKDFLGTFRGPNCIIPATFRNSKYLK